MDIQPHYITSSLAFFSTFLAELRVPNHIAQEALKNYVELLQTKTNYEQWTTTEVTEFIQQHELSTSSASLLKQFIFERNPTTIRVFLQEFITALAKAGKSDSTVKNYYSDLSQFAQITQSTSLEELFSLQTIEGFVSTQRANGLKTSSIARKLSSISQFSTWTRKQALTQTPELLLADLMSLFLTKSSTADATRSTVASTTLAQPKKLQDLLEQFKKHLEKENLSPATIKNYHSDISQFIVFAHTTSPNSPLSSVTLTRFIASQQQAGLKMASIKRKQVALSQFLHWLHNLQPELAIDALALQVLQQEHKQNPLITETPVAKSQEKVRSWKALLPKSLLKTKASPLPENSEETYGHHAVVSLLYPLLAKFQKKSENKTWLVTNAVITAIFIIGLSYFGYQQFVTAAPSILAYPATPTRPNRELSFQGRLTDTAQNPVTTATDMEFRLYDNSSGGSLLWDSGTCAITPDQDGIFNTGLGSDCGSEIDQEVFSENSNVWLEVEVDTEILTPRQSIKTVPYALNSETVQGYPISATGAATINTILTMDSGGQILLAETAPSLKVVSGSFSMDAQALTLTTSSGSNGDITLNPDGTGTTEVLSDLTSTGYITAPGATLSATYAGGTALFLNAVSGATANIFEWTNTSVSGAIDANGNIGIGTTSPAFNLDVGGDAAIGTDLTINQDLYLTRTLYANSSAGTSGQILTSAGAGVAPTWSTLGAVSITDDSLDFTEFIDAMTLDATTTVAFGGFNYVHNLNSTGDFIIQDNGTPFATFADDGTFTLDNLRLDGNTLSSITSGGITLQPLSGESLTVSLATTGDFIVNTDQLYVDTSAGNVGIGTATPGYKLDVAGTARITTNLGVFGANPSSNIAINTGTLGNSQTGLVTNVTPTGVGEYAYGVHNILTSSGNATSPTGIYNTSSAPTTSSGNMYGVRNVFDSNSTGYVVGNYNELTTTNGHIRANWNILSGTSLMYGEYTDLTISDSIDPHTAVGNFVNLLNNNSTSGSDLYGFRVTDGNSTHAATTYGLHIDVDDPDTTNYSLWIEPGSGVSYFGSNVGIGTTVPGYTLDVAGELNLTDAIRVAGNAGTSGYLLTSSGGGAMTWTDPGSLGGSSPEWSDILDPSGTLSLDMSTNLTTFNWATGTSTNDLFTLSTVASANGTGSLLNIQTGAGAAVSPLRVRAGSAEALFVNAAGNVGVGTTSPLGLFNVNGAVTGKAMVVLNQTGDQDILAASSAGTTRFRMANTGYLYAERFLDITNSDYFLDPAAVSTSLTVAGNVGIGTTSPGQLLDVVGEIELANYLYFGNGSSEYLRWDASNFILSDDLLPASDGGSDLGSDSVRWSSLYVKGSSLHIGNSGDDGIIGYNTTDNYLSFDANADATAEMLIEATGNVGIGVSGSTAARIHVSSGTLDNVASFRSSDDLARFEVRDNTTGIYFNAKDDYASIGGGNGLDATNLNIHTSTGNVGIGLIAPTQKLDIEAGNINIDNTTFANSNGIILKDGTRFIHNFNYGNNGSVTTVGLNTFAGLNSGNFSMGSTATQVYEGSYNAGFGQSTLANNTLGHQNTAIGAQSLASNTEGFHNVAVGTNSLFVNTVGTQNTAIGSSALVLNTASNNTAVGYAALYNTAAGGSNVAVGPLALFNNLGGSGNVALGYSALINNTSGGHNLAMGYNAGAFITGGVTANQTSANSLYLGYNTKASADGNTNETVIGYDGTGLGSNTVVLGNSSVVTTALRGNVGIGTTIPGVRLDIIDDSIDSGLKVRHSNQTQGISIGYNTIIANGSNANQDINITSKGTGSILLNNGNVGIGTTAPVFKLDVDGTFQADTPIRKTDYWSTLADAPSNMVDDMQALVYTDDNYIYALEGDLTTNFYRYSISGNSWSTMTAAPAAMGAYGASLVYTGGDYIYALQGGTNTAFYRYSISGNSWSTMTAAPSSVDYGASMTYGGEDYIYATLGGTSTTLYRYSIAGNSWSALADITLGDFDYGSNLVYTGGDYVYATLGGGSTALRRYTISENSWSNMTNLPSGANTGSGMTYAGGNYLYVTAGNSSTALYRYSISTNTWTTMASAPATITMGGSMTNDGNGNIYVLRGNTTATFYRYAAGFSTVVGIANLGIDLHGYNPQRDIVLVDEFTGGLLTTGNIGALGWSLVNGTTLGLAPDSSEDAIGILRLRAPNGINRAVLQLSSGAVANRILHTDSGVNTHITMRIATPTSHANLGQRIGLLDATGAGDTANGLFFRATGTGNWFAVNRAASTETGTATDCSVAQSATFQTFEILINADSSSIVYKINGTVCATHTANIPANTVILSPTFKVDNTVADATIRDMEIDRFVLTQSPLMVGADLAEFYHTSDATIGAGDIVATDPSKVENVLKADTFTNPNMLGIVSTQPGKVLGNSEGDGLPVIVGLAGRVPVKVTTANGPINAGDYITISEIPGVGVKALNAGQVVGMALESYENEDPTAVGSVLVLIKNTWHDPIAANAEQAALADIQASLEGFDLVTPDGSILTKTAAFAKATIATITAGLVNTQELIVQGTASIQDLSVDSLRIGDQTLAQYIASVVAGTNQDLPLISPLDASGSAIVNASPSATTSLLSKLMVTDAVITEDLIVGNTLLAQQIDAEIITANGIQTATIEATQADITSARIAQLEANMAQFESVRATTAELMTATVSGTLYANNIYDFENKIAASLQQPSLLALLTGQANQENANQTNQNLGELYENLSATGFNASSAAELNLTLAALNLEENDVVLGGTVAFIESYFRVNGAAFIADSLGVGNDLFVTNTLHVGSNTQIADGSIRYLTADPDNQILSIQPDGKGSIELLAGIVTIKQSGEVIIAGDVRATGSIASGSLLTNLLAPADFGNPFQVKVAGIDTQTQEVKRSRFEIIDEVGTPVATFSAQGRAEFAGGIGIASQHLGAPNENNEVITDKTSGKATIAAGQTEIKIKSTQINTNSLVYVTAVGSTGNQVLYVKGQNPENPETPDLEGVFSVGFDAAAAQDVSFNWWVVN